MSWAQYPRANLPRRSAAPDAVDDDVELDDAFESPLLHPPVLAEVRSRQSTGRLAFDVPPASPAEGTSQHKRGGPLMADIESPSLVDLRLDPQLQQDAIESMSYDLDAVTAQLTERETAHACDVLERLLGDDGGDGDGFDAAVYAACREYLDMVQAYDSKHGTAFSKFDDSDTSEMDHAMRNELQRYGSLPLARKISIFLEHPDSGPMAKAFYTLQSTIVVCTCLFTILETMPEMNPIVVPEYDMLWRTSDWVFTSVLSLETLFRFAVTVLDDQQGSKAHNALAFWRKPGNIADLVALLPTYIQPLLGSKGRVLTGSLRTARLLRIMKFLRRYQPIRRLAQALLRSVAGLFAPFCFLAMTLLLFAATLYYAERGDYNAETGQFELQNPQCLSEPRGFLNGSAACPRQVSKFVSMGQSLWWGIVTMATTGYGDFVPLTPWGMVVGALAMISGVIFMAMPIAVIGANYTQVIELGREVKSQSVAQRVMRRDEKQAAVSSATRLTMPGEAVVNALRQHLDSPVLDLCCPSPSALHVIDAVLEASVKELVDANRLAEGLVPLFTGGALIGGAESSLSNSPRASGSSPAMAAQVLPLWKATVAAGGAGADAAAAGMTPRAMDSSLRRGSVRFGGRRPAVNPVLMDATLSRPVVVTLGTQHQPTGHGTTFPIVSGNYAAALNSSGAGRMGTANAPARNATHTTNVPPEGP
jgi:hypothetical protein